MLNITDSDFNTLVHFIKQNYGIDLTKKRQLISGRLSNTLASKGYSDFTQYIKYITSSASPEDIDILLNKLTTNYTFFMRENVHFDYFRDTILPWLKETKKDRVLSVWSAGCSSGQEPYTLSMIMNEFFGKQASSWDTRVLATDISQDVLGKASAGIYEEDSLVDLPAGWKQKYFRPSGQPGKMQVTPQLKSNVIFRTFNLMDPIQFKLKFDVIFCRNVMIYFDQPTKDALVKRYYNATNPGGYLLIGHSEGLTKETNPYKYIMPATYRKQQ